MKTIQRLFLCVSLLFASNAVQAHHPHQHEKEFAARASRHELHDAFLSKCAENHYLSEALEEARKNNYSWKSIQKSFAIGVVISSATAAILYIATR